MTALDIDMGNTRTKWRHGGLTGAMASPELPTLAAQPSRVRVATVLGNRDELARGIRDHYGVDAEFATVSACLGGVRCGYAEPAQLGVDRWLAVVAAWRRSRAATVVVSAGTAATVDYVDADGRHRGGYIAPGLRLLRDSLRGGTADICRAVAGSAEGVHSHSRHSWECAGPGTDTRAAVAAGTSIMLLAYVEAAVAGFMDRGGDGATVFLTGGNAGLLARHLAVPSRCEPYLVLEGLEIALP